MLHTCKEKRLKLIEDAQARLFAKTHEGSKRKCSYDFGFLWHHYSFVAAEILFKKLINSIW